MQYTKEIYEAAKLLADFAIANDEHTLLDETALICQIYEGENPVEKKWCDTPAGV